MEWGNHWGLRGREPALKGRLAPQWWCLGREESMWNARLPLAIRLFPRELLWPLAETAKLDFRAGG